MVKIRLKRMGKVKSPFYRLVVADSRSPLNGKFIRQVGHYNPFTKELKLKKELIFQWLLNGAQPSETVKNLFKKEKILQEFTKYKAEILEKKFPKKFKTSLQKTLVSSKSVKKPLKKDVSKKTTTKAKPAVKVKQLQKTKKQKSTKKEK